jgi:hypothetical protein
VRGQGPPRAAPHASGSAKAKPREATADEHRAALLSLGDLPVGWSDDDAADESDDTSFGSGCKALDRVDQVTQPGAEALAAQVSFTHGESGPFCSRMSTRRRPPRTPCAASTS